MGVSLSSERPATLLSTYVFPLKYATCNSKQFFQVILYLLFSKKCATVGE